MRHPNLKYLFFFILAFAVQILLGQQRLILNGAMINIRNSANLVVANPNTNAITRYSGHIITEGENNVIKWNVGTATGTYIVPLGYGASYMPLIFTKSAGTGSGYFNFSSYHTGWNNAAMLPTGVSNVSYNGIDNSSYTIDRFWKIDAAGYTIKPTLTDLTFTYLDAEYLASGNSIVESTLGAQRWNSSISDWGDFIPSVLTDISANTVSIASVSSANFYTWWTLPGLNGNHALPVELTEFKGTCDQGMVSLSWSTASEFNNDHFTLERSEDGTHWIVASSIPGAGNSDRVINYTARDEPGTAVSYYRLQQTDHNGRSNYSSIINVTCEAALNTAAIEVFPNPSAGLFHLKNVPPNSTLEILDPSGNIVYSQQTTTVEPDIDLHHLSNGAYILSVQTGSNVFTHKLIIQH